MADASATGAELRSSVSRSEHVTGLGAETYAIVDERDDNKFKRMFRYGATARRKQPATPGPAKQLDPIHGGAKCFVGADMGLRHSVANEGSLLRHHGQPPVVPITPPSALRE
ncbi:hypothetical protein CMUS01_07539 [Colletotrichum musicola]|uniref:Uncharacterized protein n=1 Tax=Colletotrichum musicola TaxID=2175873 RepID=A0A8H6NFQ6_9PEZI|nr:hypothetical protein CMUS01_07539 [Colletotrichum musicola]